MANTRSRYRTDSYNFIAGDTNPAIDNLNRENTQRSLQISMRRLSEAIIIVRRT